MCHTRAVRWTLAEIAEATGGHLHGDGATAVDGVTQDSRDVRPGMLFVPLVAERRDGHSFIADAVAAGASAYLTAREPVAAGAAAVQVGDTLEALAALAQRARRRLGAVPVVGVTGSAGKTTTKDLLAAVLARDRRVWASTASFNNEIGVPITLLSAPAGTEALVVEMGSRGPGHISRLCAVARPTMGVVTTVGLSHTSELGSLAAVVAAKRELVEALPRAGDGGVAFLNAGVPEVAAMASSTDARVGHLRARRRGGGRADDARRRPDTALRPAQSRGRVCRDARGQGTALGRQRAGRGRGRPGARGFAGGRGRRIGRAGAVAAAHGSRSCRWRPRSCSTTATTPTRCRCGRPCTPWPRFPAARRIAVVGIMAELGEFEATEHAAIGSLAAELGVRVVAVDAPGYSHSDAAVTDVECLDGALAALRDLGGLGADDALLVKGSRVAGLERLVERLVAGADA